MKPITRPRLSKSIALSMTFAGLLSFATSTNSLAAGSSAKSGGLATGAAVTSSLDGTGDIVGLVASYQSYRKDLVTIANGDVDNASVRAAHRRLASHDYKTLSRAWVAYNSAVAARTPAYNKEINKAAKKNKRLLASLDASSDQVFNYRSSNAAAQSIVRNISAETAQLTEMGSSFRKAAMDMQQSKTPRMAINQTTMSRFMDPTKGDNIVLAGAGAKQYRATSLDEKSKPMMNQMLSLAAHMSVTEAKGGKYSAATATLVENRKGERCLKWAKLNLAQCLAATRNTSEEAFCTGRHALSEVSDCWSYMAAPTGVAS